MSDDLLDGKVFIDTTKRRLETQHKKRPHTNWVQGLCDNSSVQNYLYNPVVTSIVLPSTSVT